WTCGNCANLQFCISTKTTRPRALCRFAHLPICRRRRLMRISSLFGKTLREIPADAESDSHRLLLRAGLVTQTAAGIYSYLPLGWRSLRKIEQIVREEF